MLYKAIFEKKRTLAVSDQEDVPGEIEARREAPPLFSVNIMQGCDNFCSYCIVPYVRGRERSRASEDIVKEVAEQVKKGYKEVMLLGQNVNSYGKGLPEETDFAGLLEKIATTTGVERIRFMTSHPKDVSDRLLAVMRMPEGMESMLMVSEGGMAIHFPIGDVAPIGRTAAGVKGMALSAGDHVLAAMPGGFEGELVLLSDMGYAKRCLMVDFELQARAGKGSRCFGLLKNGANGKALVYADVVREPYQMIVRQKDGTRTPVDTDSIRIEMRSGKGNPYVLVVLGNDITDVSRG